MNKLSREKRIQILAALVEGVSIRGTVRMTGASKNTIVKLLEDVGAVCADYQDQVMRDLPCKRLECDEIWAFCYAKQKNVPEDKRDTFGYGDVWTWVAIDAETKLIPSWFIGLRDLECATLFIKDLAGRLANRVQLTTDGLKVYLQAVEEAFGDDIDFAQLIKVYGAEQVKEVRYSPAKYNGSMKNTISGQPENKKISTSYVERQNLTMRMMMRRFTRLTNGFSKKIENMGHAVALHFMYYNFCRVHQSLRITPAMAAGVTDRLWSLGDVVDLLEKAESKKEGGE